MISRERVTVFKVTDGYGRVVDVYYNIDRAMLRARQMPVAAVTAVTTFNATLATITRQLLGMNGVGATEKVIYTRNVPCPHRSASVDIAFEDSPDGPGWRCGDCGERLDYLPE